MAITGLLKTVCVTVPAHIILLPYSSDYLLFSFRKMLEIFDIFTRKSVTIQIKKKPKKKKESAAVTRYFETIIIGEIFDFFFIKNPILSSKYQIRTTKISYKECLTFNNKNFSRHTYEQFDTMFKAFIWIFFLKKKNLTHGESVLLSQPLYHEEFTAAFV